MPVLNMEVPINTEAYYRGETIARREGVSLYDKFAQWLNEYIEDADDAAALNDAMEKDDGTRYTSKQLREDLGVMTWHVEYTSAARKELRKMGRVNAARILDWMDKHIDGCEDPRVTGKGLTANRSGQWRYRIGDYRVLCLLRDEVVTVEVFRIRHRSEAYK